MSFIATAVLCALVCVASVFDLRTRRVPNALVVAGLVSALFLQTWEGGWDGLANGLSGFGLGLALMLPGWLLRFTGGGDVKLFAVSGAFLDGQAVFYAFALAVLTAAVMALAYSAYAWVRHGAATPMTRYGAMVTTLCATGRLRYFRPSTEEALGRRFPLTPAIAVGSIATLVFY
jgi:prepilin peptidase CpaA